MPQPISGNRIHFVEKLTNYKRIDDAADLWESMWWKLTEEKAKLLVGGGLYLHRKRATRSFFGGIIKSYRLETEGEFEGRVIFTFEFSPEFKDVLAGAGGWSLEKKIILE